MTAGSDSRPVLLQRLDGHWIATGDVRGKPVRYYVVAAATLQGKFTEISMNDVQVPSQYEARVFIGYDGETKTIIAHWMDSFGARYSVPHGTGALLDNAIEFVVPYPSGPFRDRFEYHPERDAWTLEITARDPAGGWQHFAKYSFDRAR